MKENDCHRININEELQTLYRDEIPSSDQTIADEFDIESLMKTGLNVSLSTRTTPSDPSTIVYWDIDFRKDSKHPLRLVLPGKMEYDEVIRWLKPLTDKLKIVTAKRND